MFWSTAEEEKMDRVGDVTTTVDTRKLDFVAVVFGVGGSWLRHTL